MTSFNSNQKVSEWWQPGKSLKEEVESEKNQTPAENKILDSKNGSYFGFSWWIFSFLIAMALPTSTSFHLGPVRLTMYRCILILAFIPCLIRLTDSKIVKLNICDFLMLIHSTWPILALSANHGFSVSLESGGVLFLESFIPYAIARCFVRDIFTFQNVVKFLSIMVFILAALALPESITGKHLIRDILGAPPSQINMRLGLHRAYVSFDHPIHYGVFCSSVFGLFWYGMAREFKLFKKVLGSFGVFTATFLSLSSGPLGALAAQVILTTWDNLFHFSRQRWKVLIGLIIFAYISIDFLSNRTPLKVFLTYLTFSAGTAYNRIIIWEYGSVDVTNNPIFGIGFNEWSKPVWMHSSSMDAFWLLLASRYGLPTALSLVFCLFYLYYKIIKSTSIDKNLKGYHMGWMISMAGLSICAFATHYWNSLYIYFTFLVGLGVWMIEYKKEKS